MGAVHSATGSCQHRAIGRRAEPSTSLSGSRTCARTAGARSVDRRVRGHRSAASWPGATRPCCCPAGDRRRERPQCPRPARRATRRPVSGSSPVTSAAATPRSRATATRSISTTSPPRRSASADTSRTACGPRRAVWPSSTTKLPAAYAVEVAFRKPIELPGPVVFGSQAEGKDLVFGSRAPRSP